ncbi:MAG TPA: type II secretion system protein [Armatimonadota bacterium]|nr:type II secretion system protein [Armatimonadota bacterium]
MHIRFRDRGFTLIELLVVIAIIMVLAGLLFPVFGRARGKARQESCASNLRQCAIAMRMYRDEWDDRLPPQDLSAHEGWDQPAPRMVTGPRDTIWVGQLYLYLRNIPVMRCSDASWGYVDQFNEIPYGLGLNAKLCLYTSPSGEVSAPTTKIFSESDTVLMADCSTLFFGQNPDSVMDAAYADAPSGTYHAGDIGNTMYIRHDTGSNVAYADCHVGSVSPDRLRGLVNNPQTSDFRL